MTANLGGMSQLNAHIPKMSSRNLMIFSSLCIALVDTLYTQTHSQYVTGTIGSLIFPKHGEDIISQTWAVI